MEYYSALKKNKVIWFAGEWMELECIISNVVIQKTQKEKETHYFICGTNL